MLSPIIDQLSDEYKNISFCKVNVDELNDVASQFNIMSIPTVILFSNKKMISSFTGFLPKEQIINFINQNLQKK
jgi:thioredoxin 1